MSRILDGIDCPADVKKLTSGELKELASEIREEIISTVSLNGGHLAPSLGTVELTLALYYVFDFPTDKLIWDVGHQAYAHKIITDRRNRFHTLRKKNGISGFPRRDESPYDAFGVGHASTSISAALGMALARDMQGGSNEVVAVIGDGALTGGEAFEGLNNAGDMHTHMIVVLNDNEMSIDKNVGAMSEYLSRLRVTPGYHRAKKDIQGFLRGMPRIGEKMARTAVAIKDAARAAIVPGRLFEELGFKYVGPLDGHNIDQMIDFFREVRNVDGPVLVHVHTKKGKGYKPAEKHPGKFHGIGKFDVATGECAKSTGAPKYTKVFSDALIELAKENRNIAAITAAMPSGTGLDAFRKVYPDRFFDVGIAEEHAVTLAAGMAAEGIHPVVALYSTFSQRAYDQLLHDVCLQNLPVTLCLDRAGLVGADGPTHHGVFDLSFLREMPNMTVMAPKDENELRGMLKLAISMNSPAAVRYPRGAATGVAIEPGFSDIEIGKAEVLKEQTIADVAILSIGTMTQNVKRAAEILEEDGFKCSVVNLRFAKPIDIQAVCHFAKNSRLLVTCEENVLAGGVGSAVCEVLADRHIETQVLRFGVPDQFIEHGTRDELWEICGLLPEQIEECTKEYLLSMEETESGEGKA